jgi:rhamnose utilization protein RhaD (predicted bifunctional aldolase and dehydrogenase)
LNNRAESSQIGATVEIKILSRSAASEIDLLLEASARIGSEPMLVQAATGNTSIKLDGVLWIKASGKWLSDAGQDDILIPVNLAETRTRVAQKIDPAGQTVIVRGKSLGTSVETAMHAVLPHRVVLHVHSVNTIAWAVREDGPSELARRLTGINWKWIPYVPSGLKLAAAVEAALLSDPETEVLVLANHGLVVGGSDCKSAEDLLREVESRVAISPRRSPEPDWALLSRSAHTGVWRVPPSIAIHAMGTDAVTRRMVSGGILYPCQAIFLTTAVRTFDRMLTSSDLVGVDEPFVLVDGAGTLVRQRPNPTQSATLSGLALVLQRIPESAPLRYLTDNQVRELLCADVYHYREVVEDNGAGHLTFRQNATLSADLLT